MRKSDAKMILECRPRPLLNGGFGVEIVVSWYEMGVNKHIVTYLTNNDLDYAVKQLALKVTAKKDRVADGQPTS